MNKILLAFGAGSFAALIQLLTMWAFTHYGVSQSIGVHWASGISPGYIYPRIVWGGLWGFLFLLPIMSSHTFLRSFVIALIPTAVQLFYVFPYIEGKGFAGLTLGVLTPALVYFFWWLWAMVVSFTNK